jgi:transposase-like protein
MKNVREENADKQGDFWTWTALDADSKLIVSYLVGQRGPAWAKVFMEDVASRIASRIQITTDGHKAYAEAVKGAFGMDCDYAMLRFLLCLRCALLPQAKNLHYRSPRISNLTTTQKTPRRWGTLLVGNIHSQRTIRNVALPLRLLLRHAPQEQRKQLQPHPK